MILTKSYSLDRKRSAARSKFLSSFFARILGYWRVDQKKFLSDVEKHNHL